MIILFFVVFWLNFESLTFYRSLLLVRFDIWYYRKLRHIRIRDIHESHILLRMEKDDDLKLFFFFLSMKTTRHNITVPKDQIKKRNKKDTNNEMPQI